MNRYIAFDCESGGVDTDKSLLTLYMVALDEQFEPIGEIDLKIKPNAGKPYIVTGEALGINKINLVEHDKVAISESEAGAKLREFLVIHSMCGKIKLVPIGHNVGFDEDFIHAHVLNKREYQQYVSYRKLDTAVVAQFLKAGARLPEVVTGSLSSLMDHYGIKFEGSAHEARADTHATVQVLKMMLR